MIPRIGAWTRIAPRRATLIPLLGLALSTPAICAAAGYPDRPVTIAVGFAAGGFTDLVARLVAKGLGEQWHQPVIVENRAGAGGNLAATYVARKPADGYTLLMSNVASNAINPSVYRHLDFDAEKDFEPIVLVVKTPNAGIVSRDSPYHSMADLIAAAKKKPGSINFGTPGVGTSGHLTGELFAQQAGIKMTHIPYKGTSAVMMDLINGNVQITFDNIVPLSAQVNAGKARALAVTSLSRSPLLPDTPTMEELGFKGFEATSWFGLSAPKGTPDEIVQKINADVNRVIADPDFKAKMQGGEVVGGTSASFARFQSEELKKWQAVAKSVGIQVE